MSRSKLNNSAKKLYYFIIIYLIDKIRKGLNILSLPRRRVPCHLFRRAVCSGYYSYRPVIRTIGCPRSRELVNYPVGVYYSYVPAEKRGRRMQLQSSRGRNAKFVGQVRKHRRVRNTICPNIGPTTVYLSFHARRAAWVIHRYIPRYLAWTGITRNSRNRFVEVNFCDPRCNVFSADRSDEREDQPSRLSSHV